MPAKINPVAADHYIEVELSGKLSKEDYATFVPVVEKTLGKPLVYTLVW